MANAGPDQTLECAGPNGTSVRLDGSGSSDLDNDPLIFAWTGPFGAAGGPKPTVALPPGAHTITLLVDDGHGGTATDTVVVTVGDTAPPSIWRVAARPNILWPPNHQMVPVTVAVAVTDRCSTTTCKIVSVASNEPVNGTGDGDTAPDWEIAGDLTVNLRAERAGTYWGRAYTIAVQCTDTSKNSTLPYSVIVKVPHHKERR